LEDLFLQRTETEHATTNTTTSTHNSSSASVDEATPFTLGNIAAPHERPNLLLVSRDGFVQTYSWTTLSFIKDVNSKTKKGITAACLIPPRFVKFASATLADKPLIQKSALQLKKAPVSSAGARVFMMKALWSFKSNTNGSNNEQQQPQQQKIGEEAFVRIRQRDAEVDEEEAILARNEKWLRELEIAVMKEKEEELLEQANELFAAKQ
jgi:hypothetical protein